MPMNKTTSKVVDGIVSFVQEQDKNIDTEQLVNLVNSKAVGNDVSKEAIYITDTEGELLDDNKVRVKEEVYTVNDNPLQEPQEPLPMLEDLENKIEPSLPSEGGLNVIYDTDTPTSTDDTPTLTGFKSFDEGTEYIYKDGYKSLANVIPIKEEEKPTKLWEDFKVGLEVGSSGGQFLSNRELYDSKTYATSEKNDPSFSFNDPEVVAYLDTVPTRLLRGIEEAVNFEHLKLIIDRAKYDEEVHSAYNDAGSLKYAGLVASFGADPLNTIPLAGAFKLLNSASTLTKFAGYGAVGAGFGVADEALRGSLQNTETDIGSSAFWGGAIGIGLGGVSTLLSRAPNMSGASESLLDTKASTKAAKVTFMYTPTERLLNSNSPAFVKLGKLLNRAPTKTEGEVVQETANDVKYNVQNIGAQAEEDFKVAYKEAKDVGYSGTYDEYLEDGLGEIIGAKRYADVTPIVEGEIQTTGTENIHIANTNTAGLATEHAEIHPKFLPLLDAIQNSNSRLNKYLDETLPISTYESLDLELKEKLARLDDEIALKQTERVRATEEGKLTDTIDSEILRLDKAKLKVIRQHQHMGDVIRLKSSLAQGGSHLTKYFTINTKAVSSMSQGEFVNKVYNSVTYIDRAPKYVQDDIRRTLAKAHKEIITKYTRGDTEDFIITKLLTYDEIPMFANVVNRLNPLQVKDIMYSDAGIASHYFHTELAGNVGLVSKGFSTNDDMFREYLEGVSQQSMKEGLSAEEARQLSTQALDLYRQIRGDFMSMPSAGGMGEMTKLFNNTVYSAVGGGFGVLSIMDIAVGVGVNGFKDTFKSMGKSIVAVRNMMKNKDPKAIQEALQLGAGGEMTTGLLRSRFFEQDGLATTRTLNKTLGRGNDSMWDWLLTKSDWMADKVATVSGLRHISSWLQHTSMYATMSKFTTMAAKKGTLTPKENKYLADLGLTHDDLKQIPLDKVQFDSAGNPLLLNIVDWDNAELVHKITTASNRSVNNAVIKADVTELPNWFSHMSSSPIGSLITSFQKYLVASHSSILKRGFYGDKLQFTEGIATAMGILVISKYFKEQALIQAGLLDESDAKYDIIDSLGNLDEEALTKLMYDVVTYVPQLGSVSTGLGLGQTLTGTSVIGEDVYQSQQLRGLGNLGNVLDKLKYVGSEFTGDADALDRLFQLKSITPMNNLYYLDSLYMPPLKDAIE